MNITTNTIKFRLIELIMRMDSTPALQELEKQAQRIAQVTPNVKDAIRPIRSNVSLEDIKREQNYKPVSYQKFRAVADELALEEPIEELLAMLSK